MLIIEVYLPLKHSKVYFPKIIIYVNKLFKNILIIFIIMCLISFILMFHLYIKHFQLLFKIYCIIH